MQRARRPRRVHDLVQSLASRSLCVQGSLSPLKLFYLVAASNVQDPGPRRLKHHAHDNQLAVRGYDMARARREVLQDFPVGLVVFDM